MKPNCRIVSNHRGGALGDQTRSTLPPSSGGIGIRLKNASSRLITTACRRMSSVTGGLRCPTPPRWRACEQPGGTRSPAACCYRPGGRDDHEVAARVAQAADVDRHRLRPSDDRQAADTPPSAAAGASRSGRCARAGSATSARACAPSDRRVDRRSTRVRPRGCVNATRTIAKAMAMEASSGKN